MKRNSSRFFQIGARDLNEPLVTAVLDRAHVLYKLLPPGFGADILIIQSPPYFVEVKNPFRPPSKRKLTDDEIELQEHCRIEKIDYHVVEQPEQMAEIINRKAEAK